MVLDHIAGPGDAVCSHGDVGRVGVKDVEGVIEDGIGDNATGVGRFRLVERHAVDGHIGVKLSVGDDGVAGGLELCGVVGTSERVRFFPPSCL